MRVNRIAVLTSGGDAPGMNAAIRAVTRTALAHGVSVVGVGRGFHGLIRGELHEMNSRSVGDIIHRGGTILRSARSETFQTPEGQKRAAERLAEAEVGAVVVIGGNGSFRGALALTRMGFPSVGVPATIDNDLGRTDVSIGFDTAINTVIDGINKIRDTATSHERTYVVEVMGRNSGFIALWSGLAGGAESILIPEAPVDIDRVCEKIVRGHETGKTSSIVVVAEGLYGDPHRGANESAGFHVGRLIREKTGFEVRVSVLGHLQRGGNPTAADRILAQRLGSRAAELAIAGEGGMMVGMVHRSVLAFPIEEAIEHPLRIDLADYRLLELMSAD